LNIVNLLTTEEIKTAQNEEKAHGGCLPTLVDSAGIPVKRKGLFTRYYIPVSLRSKVIGQFHHEFDHIGVKKMLQMICKSYYWPDMTGDVKNFVNTCSVCLINNVHQS